MDNIIEPGSIISVGKYEILYCSALYYDEETQMGENKKVIQYLNGAPINCSEIDLEYKIDWVKNSENINSISFKMPHDSDKLSNVFMAIPFGLLKKNRTGIGATTLELLSSRNSIVVVPTKALAYGKAINSRIDGEENKYKILYVGGKIEGFNVPKISAYLSDISIRYKKFIVVADSLPLVLNAIGEENYKDYFLLVDEIDSYQYDCDYRPRLEDVIDYYFKFPQSQRCLVSATIGQFCNKAIEEEPVINVEFNESQSRKIKLIHTDDVNVRVKMLIEEVIATNPDAKILIAYNSMSNCTYIINSLDEELKVKCGILCSARNSGVSEYYSDMTGDLLPKQISFMTCTYFVGVDIMERFHLISVCNSKLLHTLLSTDKLKQIAGRCRRPEGLLSETVIYSTTNRNDNISSSEVCSQALIDAQELSSFAELYLVLKEKFPNEYQFRENFDCDDYIQNSYKRYAGTKAVRLLRKDINGKIVPSYFNLDNIRIRIELYTNLYTNSSYLKDKLIQEGNDIEYNEYSEEAGIGNVIIEETDERSTQANLLQREEIISLLQEQITLEYRNNTANYLRTRCSVKNEQFLDFFIKLQKYVPFEILIRELKKCDTRSEYNKFYNYILFWALEDGHAIKVTLWQNFPIGRTFTGEVLTEKFNAIYSGILGYRNLTPRQAIPIIRNFCKLSGRTSIRGDDGKPKGAYRILGYNPFGFDGEPLQRIPLNENMRSKFVF